MRVQRCLKHHNLLRGGTSLDSTKRLSVVSRTWDSAHRVSSNHT